MHAVIRWAALAVALAACGGEPDPCDGAAAACVGLHLSSDRVDAFDQLELDVLYGDAHDRSTLAGNASLPATTAVILDDATATVDVAIVVAAKRNGAVLGTGAASVSLDPGEHASADVALEPPGACVAASLYCGGDKLAGDPGVLYECNAGGAPIAHGWCVHGCVTHPTDDDACSGGAATCIDGGRYCGGDKVDGDPAALYTCSGGAGTAPMACADGCVVAPAGQDDHCR